jgi:hypothetical protein
MATTTAVAPCAPNLIWQRGKAALLQAADEEVAVNSRTYFNDIIEPYRSCEAGRYLSGEQTDIQRFKVNYVTDMGLRREPSPYIVSRSAVFDLEQHLALVPPRVADHYLADLFGIPSTDVRTPPGATHKASISYYINVLGSWNDGAAIARLVACDWDKPGVGPSDKFFAACVLAIAGDATCRDMFQKLLSERSLSDKYSHFTLAFRSLVFCVKKPGGGSLVDDDYRQCQQVARDTATSPDELRFYEAMIGNIIALHHSRSNRRAQAVSSIEKSVSAMQEVEPRELHTLAGDLSIYYRYRAQAWINFCTTLATRGLLSDAIDQIERCLSFTESFSPESVFECLSMRAIYLMRLLRFEEAEADLRRAECILATEFRIYPLIRHNVRQMLMACLYKVGREDEAEEMLSVIDANERFFIRIGLNPDGSWHA